ncbi:MAG: FAD-dependent oxidoreductase [Arcobacter sp.]|nr:FAD-dependent oxidoreductase [Arcobacter sp.]
MYKEYDYVIIGAGIAGSSTSYFLSKHFSSILLIDRNCDVAQGASGAAGAFLSPLLGKPNKFKDLVTSALKFSSKLYKENIPEEINNCGVVRIPKNNEDLKKFKTYEEYMDFPYEKYEDGYLFKIGSQVNSYNICNFLTKNIEKKFNYEVNKIEKKDGFWLINDEIKAINLILTTGADISLIEEKYFSLRAVWGQKIDVYTNSNINRNYHKECSLSASKFDDIKKKNIVSIGATHHRFNCDLKVCNHCIKSANINKIFSHSYSQSTVNKDTEKLLKLANDIKHLDDVEVFDIKIGARASSVDYFPMVGKLIDSKKTIEKYPHLKNGSFIKDDMFSMIDNLYVLNGVGGRGFVLSPYLAYNLVESILKNNFLEESIKVNRLFKRWVKRSS